MKQLILTFALLSTFACSSGLMNFEEPKLITYEFTGISPFAVEYPDADFNIVREVIPQRYFPNDSQFGQTETYAVSVEYFSFKRSTISVENLAEYLPWKGIGRILVLQHQGHSPIAEVSFLETASETAKISLTFDIN